MLFLDIHCPSAAPVSYRSVPGGEVRRWASPHGVDSDDRCPLLVVDPVLLTVVPLLEKP